MRLLYRVEIVNRNNSFVKHDKGLILCSNHSSSLDPIMMCTYFPEPIFFISKAELFKNRFVRSVLQFFNSFPINRSGFPRESIKMSLKILNRGNVFGIFPEGTRSANGKIGEGREGIGLVAYLSKAPILPMAVYNSKKDPKRKKSKKDVFSKIRVIFGELIITENIISAYPKREAIEKITDITMNNIKMLYCRLN
ncbi:MAG: 1-acyl-sn-glycerol-3-phosphate acyltransferase [Actinobacteria bacterium]|nr:1-acyl-sn-glycerol-3-phosphate acyltransferase [Actinomycetota bacterium]MCL6088129.1 1-acyl-sn-glycerol-3-phosphate acyltransferase [Actinomycetota bacterium]